MNCLLAAFFFPADSKLSPLPHSLVSLPTLVAVLFHENRLWTKTRNNSLDGSLSPISFQYTESPFCFVVRKRTHSWLLKSLPMRENALTCFFSMFYSSRVVL